MRLPTFLLYLLLFSLCSFAQEDNSWLAGTWKGSGDVPRGHYATHFIRSMEVTLGMGNSYTIIYTNALNDRNKTMIKSRVQGEFYDNQFHRKSREIIYIKQPPSGKWGDCSACDEKDQFIIEGNKLKLVYFIQGCRTFCDGAGFYYKELSSFDLPTQRYLYRRFGSRAQMEKFELAHPLQPPLPQSTQPKPALPKPAPEIPAMPVRETKELRTYNITDKEITLELYDNREEDGDTVSVFDNNKLIVDRLELRNEPKKIIVYIDSYNSIHEITLVANNLGRVPPNTATLIVTAGNIQEELEVRMDLKQSAKIIFKYTGK